MSGAARARAPGAFLRLNHGLTHYELDDDATRPLLICIHGWSTASYVWDPLKPLLRAQGYRVLSYDLYGRGFSDRPKVAQTAKLFTHQLTELLDRLSLNTQPLNVVGYSMGGAIAARFVSERMHQVERLLLIAPAGMAVRAPGLRAFAQRYPRLTDPHILALLPPVLRRQFQNASKGFKDDPTVQLIANKQMRELSYRGYLPSLLSSLKGVLATRMQAEHEAITRSPVAVRAIFASEDTTIPHPQAKALFDQWTAGADQVSHIMTGAGHALAYTHAQQILQSVRDFLSEAP
ncbi:alpha/beta fold hydrolase [Falsiruegeria litorea]|nr:alpha/beta hydrolase [Falsiruegeria litorea]